MGVGGHAQPEPAQEPDLAQGARQQVGSPDDLADALVGVVDGHREVVGEGAVVAAHDEVVDGARLGAGQPVGEGHRCFLGAHPQGGRTA